MMNIAVCVKVRKLSGGLVLLLALSLISYTLTLSKQPPTPYHFFHTHPNDAQFATPTMTTPPRKPRFVDFEGLDQLYAPHNLSSQGTTPLLVWGQMRSLLSRSDALPQTAQGVKEAALAWKELLSTIQEKADMLSSDNGEGYCPFSVDKLKTGAVLELPCGLIEDSSISLVGVPEGPDKSFQIRLLGSRLSGQSSAPVVLQYNVRLPGEKLTEEPFIVQNTWTEELGWGTQERCPPLRSTANFKVDGLVACNKRAFRSSLEENQSASGKTLANVSGPSDHEAASFPFGEGIPFIATLRAGADGFHMSVNGRHETSFAYGEKLERWSVSKVKIGGGLKLLSALANGLPVAEDHDVVVDSKRLKAPPIGKKRLVMLVGVFSTGNNFERRMALRRSWMQYTAVRSGDVAVRFFIGLHKKKEVNYELWREGEAYGDIQFMPFVDYYTLITLKTIAICIMGTKILPAKYIMKTDDDAFVRIDQVLSSVKAKAANGVLYGLMSFDSSPHRDKESKWYISDEEWGPAFYPPWAHGPGYIISRDIAKFVVRGHHDRNLKLFKLEDVAMGIWIEEFKKSGGEVQYVSDEKFHNAGCEADFVLAHYQSPRLLLCLWDNLRRQQHNPSCCE